MKNVVEFITRSVVSRPDMVTVDEKRDGEHVLISLKVASEDRGAIIGRRGRTVSAIQSVVDFMASRHQLRVKIDVSDAE